jgi:hypothetical protein
MSKKLALLLFGRAYLTKENRVIIDYMASLNNYREYIFKHFESIGYTIDVFFATNDDIPDFQKKELIEDYQPVANVFVKDLSNQYESRTTKVRKVLELCRSHHEIYDHVLLTRFDLIFNDKFNESNIDYGRLNFVSILEAPKLLCDNFYFFPYSLLDAFIKVANEKVNNTYKGVDRGHCMHYYIEPFKNHFKEFNFIKNENRRVEYISFYTIKRHK